MIFYGAVTVANGDEGGSNSFEASTASRGRATQSTTANPYTSTREPIKVLRSDYRRRIMVAEGIGGAVASKFATKALDAIFKAAEGRVRDWWRKNRNRAVSRKLADKILRIDRIKTLHHTQSDVPLTSIYYPSKVIFDDRKPVRVDSISELPPSTNYIIEGTVGQGKSVFLRYLCLSQLRLESDRIPIFQEFRYLDSKKTLREFIFDAFRSYGFFIDDEFFEYYAGTGQFLLLLDAFDEIPADAITPTVYALQKLVEQYPRLQILITSRPGSSLHPSTYFKVIKLAGLQPPDHQKFLERLLSDTARAKKIASEIRRSDHQIQALLTTPLLMTLLAVIYNADQSIPQNEAEFYQRLFDVLLYRHDRTKLGFRRQRYTDFGEHQIQELFEAFCFITRQANLGTLSPEDYSRCLKMAMTHTGLNVDPIKFKDEMIKVACLLQEEGFSLQFIHKSVQEFYSSAFILHSPEAVAKKFYRTMSTHWKTWAQEIRFLSITDKYRFSRFFLRDEMRKFAKKLELTVDDRQNLLCSSRSVRIILNSVTAGLDLSERSDRILTSLGIVRDSGYASEVPRIDIWGAESGYILDVIVPIVHPLWIAIANIPLEKIIPIARSHSKDHQDKGIEINCLELFSSLNMEKTFEAEFQIKLGEVSNRWREAEELIAVHEGRISII